MYLFLININVRMSYKIGKVTFGTKEAKEAWILKGILLDIEYIENVQKKNLSPTEKELIKISKRRLKSLIKNKYNVPI